MDQDGVIFDIDQSLAVHMLVQSKAIQFGFDHVQEYVVIDQAGVIFDTEFPQILAVHILVQSKAIQLGVDHVGE